MAFVDSPLADFEVRQCLDDQKVAVVSALACWRDQRSLGSNNTPRYLYEPTGRDMLVEIVSSLLGQSRLNPSR